MKKKTVMEEFRERERDAMKHAAAAVANCALRALGEPPLPVDEAAALTMEGIRENAARKRKAP